MSKSIKYDTTDLKPCPFCGSSELLMFGRYYEQNQKVMLEMGLTVDLLTKHDPDLNAAPDTYHIHHGPTHACAVSMMDSDKATLIDRWNGRGAPVASDLELSVKIRLMMRLFLDSIRSYEGEADTSIFEDERWSEEFVSLFINSEDGDIFRTIMASIKQR